MSYFLFGDMSGKYGDTKKRTLGNIGEPKGKMKSWSTYVQAYQMFKVELKRLPVFAAMENQVENDMQDEPDATTGSEV